jgi:hypothetical protein
MRGKDDSHCARGERAEVSGGLDQGGREYGVSSYTKQRLQLLKMEIDSLFKNEKARQTGLADFM